MNIPNILTGLRFLMIPLYCWVFSIEPEAKFWSAAIFVLASLTDVLDGYIARKYDMTTKWGQLMDPLADKLMQIAVIITMVLAGIVPNWFVMVLVIKECLFIFGSIFLYTKKTFVQSNIFGKLNTVVLFVAMTILLVFPDTNPVFENVILGVSVAMGVCASVSYLYSYFLQQKKFKQYIGAKNTSDLEGEKNT